MKKYSLYKQVGGLFETKIGYGTKKECKEIIKNQIIPKNFPQKVTFNIR